MVVSQDIKGLGKKAFLLAGGFFVSACSGGVSGEVGQACMASDRKAASRSLCSCIQSAANRTLNASDQAYAAELLSEPERVQEIKKSKGRADRRFWSRYNKFTKTAQNQCR